MSPLAFFLIALIHASLSQPISSAPEKNIAAENPEGRTGEAAAPAAAEAEKKIPKSSQTKTTIFLIVVFVALQIIGAFIYLSI